MDDLIEEYASQWAHAFAVLAPAHQPSFIEALQQAAGDGSLALNNSQKGRVDVTISIALTCGPIEKALQRRGWPFPTPSSCSVCGASHFFDFARYWLVRQFGGPGVCVRCLLAAADGPASLSIDEGLAALTRLAEIAEIIPPQDFRKSICTSGLAPDKRTEVVAALACAPRASELREALGGVPWLQVLQRAGIVGDAWRPSRGVMCTAADGHPCRSLSERTIDDWLSSRGVPHELEPHYPQHPVLNPGRMRADWLIDGVFVEFAGLLANSAYAEKIARKRELASISDTELIVIVPEDLVRLDRALGRFTEGHSSPTSRP